MHMIIVAMSIVVAQYAAYTCDRGREKGPNAGVIDVLVDSIHIFVLAHQFLRKEKVASYA